MACSKSRHKRGKEKRKKNPKKENLGGNVNIALLVKNVDDAARTGGMQRR